MQALLFHFNAYIDIWKGVTAGWPICSLHVQDRITSYDKTRIARVARYVSRAVKTLSQCISCYSSRRDEWVEFLYLRSGSVSPSYQNRLNKTREVNVETSLWSAITINLMNWILGHCCLMNTDKLHFMQTN